MNLIFMGTPDFAVPALEAVLDAGHRVLAVYTQPPRPAGRGHRERRSPVHDVALVRGLPVRTPTSLKNPSEQRQFAALNADAAVVAAYGLILPPAILAAPRSGCLNIHASLLPRWRGAAPIQRAIEAGDPETGVTIMQMDEGLDTGPMLLWEKVPIASATTAGELHDELARRGAALVVAALGKLSMLDPVPQPEEGVTYARKIAKHEARIDWREPSERLERRIRALSPAPAAWFEAASERIRVLNAAAVAASGRPGTVLDERLTVACGTGAVRLLRLQRAGKEPMAAGPFARGFALRPGTVLA